MYHVCKTINDCFYVWCIMLISDSIEASTELEENSYYMSVSVKKDDESIATIDLVTDKGSVLASEAIIGKIAFMSELGNPMNTIMFDGVALTEVTTDVFKEHVSGCKIREDGMSAFYTGKKYYVSIVYENGSVSELEMKRKYDVDFNS